MKDSLKNTTVQIYQNSFKTEATATLTLDKLAKYISIDPLLKTKTADYRFVKYADITSLSGEDKERFTRLVSQYTSEFPLDLDNDVQSNKTNLAKIAYAIKRKEFPGITAVAHFDERADDNYIEGTYNYTCVLDVDLQDNVDIDVDDLKASIMSRPWVIMMFKSPSGGLKVWVRLKYGAFPVNRAKEVVDTFVIPQMTNIFNVKFDNSQSRFSQLCYLSHDPEVFYNPNAEELDIAYTHAKPDSVNATDDFTKFFLDEIVFSITKASTNKRNVLYMAAKQARAMYEAGELALDEGEIWDLMCDAVDRNENGIIDLNEAKDKHLREGWEDVEFTKANSPVVTAKQQWLEHKKSTVTNNKTKKYIDKLMGNTATTPGIDFSMPVKENSENTGLPNADMYARLRDGIIEELKQKMLDDKKEQRDKREKKKNEEEQTIIDDLVKSRDVEINLNNEIPYRKSYNDRSEEEKQQLQDILDRDYLSLGPDYIMKYYDMDQHSVERMEFKNWKPSLINQWYGPGTTFFVKRYIGWKLVPDNINFKQIIKGRDGKNFYNLYHKFPHQPKEGSWENIEKMLRHIFTDRYDVIIDYLWVLYFAPWRHLPILSLVSENNKTGKTTFIDWLQALLGNNMNVIGSRDLTDTFNSHYAACNVIAIEEALVEKDSAMNKLKALVTQDYINVNPKFVQPYRLPSFHKVILLSNKEDDFIKIEQAETRFWIEKVKDIKESDRDTRIIEKMIKEIPAFLHYLTTLPAYDYNVDRSSIDPKRYETRQLHKVKDRSKSWLYRELMSIFKDYFDKHEYADKVEFTPIELYNEFFKSNKDVSRDFLIRTLKKELHLEPVDKASKYSPTFVYSPTKINGRYYTVTREMITGEETKEQPVVEQSYSSEDYSHILETI